MKILSRKDSPFKSPTKEDEKNCGQLKKVPHRKDVKCEVNDAQTEEINIYSKYVERVEIEGLTLYDIQRDPRKLITCPAMITTPLRPLSLEFTCPICLRLMRHTMLVMECLHRFCSECIQKCLRVGKKECPSCRIHIPSRRSLRNDTAYDRLIALVYPDLEHYEALEEKKIEEFNRTHNIHNAFTESFQRVNDQQVGQKRKKQRVLQDLDYLEEEDAADESVASPQNEAESDHDQESEESSDEESGSASTSSDSESEENETTGGMKTRNSCLADNANPNEAQCASVQHPIAHDEVSFLLKRHPLEKTVKSLNEMLVKVQRQASVRHIKKFLAIKLGYNQFKDFEVILAVGKTAVILSEQLTLQEIKEHFCRTLQSELLMYYRVAPKQLQMDSSQHFAGI